jgi:hypothetical protein
VPAVSVILKVKSEEAAVRKQREATAGRVLDYLGGCLPSSRLLCFLDDDDPQALRREYGSANRGGYMPIHDNIPLVNLPGYVTDCIFVDDGVSIPFPRVVDGLIYLYGSTCANNVGLTMTLAHELQHAIQHANVRKVWAVNGLVPNLGRKIIDALKLTWVDIPIEREARIVSKRAALYLFGEQRVNRYIDEKIAEHVTEADAADWQFVRKLTASSSVDLVAESKRLFNRLKGYKAEVEAALLEKKESNNPDFLDIDLSTFFDE